MNPAKKSSAADLIATGFAAFEPTNGANSVDPTVVLGG